MIEHDGGVAPPQVLASGFGWTYAGRPAPALRGLTFRIPSGSVLLVLGPSGSGKSTLARALAGIVPHALHGRWEGRLAVGDLDVPITPPARLGERVGIVFQDPESQLVMARVEDEVAFGLENRGWSRAAMLDSVPRVLQRVGLAGFEPRLTQALSGGEQQRLAIADVLAPLPGCIVLDEPTANLDPPGMAAVFDVLGALASERRHTIVIVEHRVEAALPLADLVLILDAVGQQIAFGPPAEVGPRHAATLERSGGWVPSAWLRGATGGHGWSAGRVRVAGGERTVGGRLPKHPVVEARGIVVRYPAETPGSWRTALDGVGLRLHPGERVALVGPNGSGKSTLLSALAGLRRPDSGTVRVGDGRAEPSTDPSRLRSDHLADLVGLLFQDPELGFVAPTVGRETVARTARRSGRGEASTSAVLARFGLAGFADWNPYQLSQGEQRRLSLAAYALDPPAILLLDEPTFGLDRLGAERVLGLLDEASSGGQAQLLATHDPRLLPACDRVVALESGHVVFDGAVAEFLAAPPYRPAEPWRAGVAVPRAEMPGSPGAVP